MLFFSPCALLVPFRAVVLDFLPFILLFFSMPAFFLSLCIEICPFFIEIKMPHPRQSETETKLRLENSLFLIEI